MQVPCRQDEQEAGCQKKPLQLYGRDIRPRPPPDLLLPAGLQVVVVHDEVPLRAHHDQGLDRAPRRRQHALAGPLPGQQQGPVGRLCPGQARLPDAPRPAESFYFNFDLRAGHFRYF